jgi:catechol 2,3-dioxygenase-like lactoylglutathione lyase family enzyme
MLAEARRVEAEDADFADRVRSEDPAAYCAGTRAAEGNGVTAMPDRSDLPAPTEGLVLTHFLTVRDVAISREFYADIFGGQVVLAKNPAIVKIANSWIILNPGGGPTPDKPDVTLVPPQPGDPVSAFLNVRVADIAAFYEAATAKGAQFLTEPLDRKAEVRCYLRDPDGYLIEIGQATGMLEGIYADLTPDGA